MVPFQKDINERAIAKFFVCDKMYTFRMQFKHSKTVVDFYNNGKKLVELPKDRPIGILDLHSIGHCKVNYQRLIAMAEEKFGLFHYCKSLPSEENKNAEQYNRMSGTKNRERINLPKSERTDPYPWLALDDPH